MRKLIFIGIITSMIIGNARITKGIIQSVENDIVTIETTDGNVWLLESAEDTYKNTIECIIVFDTMETNSIYDDTIINVIPIR